MRCVFEYVGPLASHHQHVCTVCKAVVSVPTPDPGRVTAICGTIVAAKPLGPGARLQQIFSELRIASCGDSTCKEMAAEMDALGIEGCQTKRDELADRLRERAKGRSMGEKIAAAAMAVKTGLAARINWLDPFPGLIDEAIRRAESAA